MFHLHDQTRPPSTASVRIPTPGTSAKKRSMARLAAAIASLTPRASIVSEAMSTLP